MNRMLSVSYGGGTNSTAMLCRFRDMDVKPDLIMFADTGAEMPHTYEYLEMMKDKVREWWGMQIEIVRKLYQGRFEGLEGQCVRHGYMPSLAYGRRSCSVKYKIEPQVRKTRSVMKERAIDRVLRAIGFDHGESHRIKPAVEPWCDNWYPLAEQGIERDACKSIICRHGLSQPGKSSCFFCPSMKRSEVMILRDKYPDLLKRALAIEDAAQKTNKTNRGLGGKGNLWRDWLAMDRAQEKLFLDIEPEHVPCGCID